MNINTKKIFDSGLKNILVSSDYFIGKYIKSNISDTNTKEVVLSAGETITQEKLDKLMELKIHNISIADIDPINKGPYFKY